MELITLLGNSGAILIIICTLIVLLIASIMGNIGVDWKEKKFTFGSKKQSKTRSCGDCISLVLAKRIGYESIYWLKQSSILRSQMTFVEHKIVEIEQIVKREITYRLKDEFRRSFKENGFFEMNETDYARYILERSETSLNILNSSDTRIISIIKEIYDNAKSVKTRVDLELKKLEEEFILDIDNLIKEI